MNSEQWKKITWGEVATLEYGKSLKDYRDSDGAIPVFGTNGQIGYTNKALCKEPGVIIGRKGAYRGIHFSNTPFFVIDTAFYLKPKSDNLNIVYAYYQLLTQNINDMDSGSAIPSTSREDFYNLKLSLPPIEIQKKIGQILWSLDKKIEYSKQINQTLESLALTLFNELCVPPSDELSSGWTLEPLDSVAEFLNGLALQKYPAVGEPDYLPVIKIKELKNGITNSTDKASRNVPRKYVVQNGDLLFSWSATLEVMFWCYGKGALNQHLFKVTSEKYPLWFCYMLIQYHIKEFRRIASDKTTTMGHIQRRHLTEALCFVPPNFEQVSKIISPIIEQIKANSLEIQNIIALKQMLLPKLIKGEVEIDVSK